MKKFVSYAVACLLGALAVAPPIPYALDLQVNSFLWVYLIVMAALVSFYLMTQKINVWIKILVVYLFFNCFLSQVPFMSFTAYMVAVMTVLFFSLCLYIDFEPLLNVLQAVFWLQVAIGIMQRMDKDTLMSFGMPDKNVYFGTVFQGMRLGSLFAIMAPFLLMKSKWYLIPLAIVAFALGTLGFSFALAGGVMVWVLMSPKTKIVSWKWKLCVILYALLFCVLAADTNDHIHAELTWGRWPIWGLIFRTWFLDTTVNFHGFKSSLNPAVQNGPFDLMRFLFGHGLGTFNAMFPFYKYDQNAFRPAHNDWLQTPWEIGLIGAILEDLLLFGVFYFVARAKDIDRIAGLVMIAINRFLAFPDHMTQTNLLMVAYMANCYRSLPKKHK